MDLSLTENQEMLKSSAREFIQSEYSKDTLLGLDRGETGRLAGLWKQAANMGWLGIAIPESYGGQGGTLTDAGVLYQELGRGPVPGPFFSSSILGAFVVLEGGTEDQKVQFLQRIADGRQTLALAVTESDYTWDPRGVQLSASRHQGRFILEGSKLFVHDAAAASHLICAVRTETTVDPSAGISLLIVDKMSPGVSVKEMPGFISGVSEVKFNSVEVPDTGLLGQKTGVGWDCLQSAMAKAIPILCAYQVGGCEAVFDMSVAHSQTRVQFGVPIGRFQRVQDHIINIVDQLDAARWTTYEALWKLDSAKPADGAIHLAKAVASEGYYEACNHAHEVHAGVGVMTEYGLTLHTKMSRTLYPFLGDPRYHKRRLAEALDL